ncbi:hypothetical protein AAZX31_01G052600 [Glycine max]
MSICKRDCIFPSRAIVFLSLNISICSLCSLEEDSQLSSVWSVP